MSNEVENLMTGRALNKLTAKMIIDAKNKCYADLGKRLCDPSVGIKTHWRTLHKIINKKQAMNTPPPPPYSARWCVYYKFSKQG